MVGDAAGGAGAGVGVGATGAGGDAGAGAVGGFEAVFLGGLVVGGMIRSQ